MIRAQFKVFDGPLEGAKIVAASDDRSRAEQIADHLNRINFRQDGPWGYGRYWVDEPHRGTTITELEEIVDSVVRCESCGDATNNAEPFCNGPICFKRGD